MRLSTKCQLLSLILVNSLALNACSNSNAANNKIEATSSSERKAINSQPTVTISTPNIQSELDKAKKAGKAVFVVVTGSGVTDTDKASEVAKGANDIYKNAVIVQFNRDEEANTKLVSEWRLAGAPLPLIMVISPKGYPAGGYILKQATAENIAEIVPSPKMDDVYEAINNSKPVFLVISKKSFTDRSKILDNCKSAISQLQNKASMIEIDLNDTKEAKFLKQLNLKNTPNASSVLVLNASGQTTGSFEGTVETTQLVLAANKVVKSSCCPSGSGSSCK